MRSRTLIPTRAGWCPIHSSSDWVRIRQRSFASRSTPWGHRRVVDAVAAELAQGGSVDGYVWDTLQILHPEVTEQTRIAHRSAKYGFPPFVTRTQLPESDFRQLQGVLVAMKSTPNGKRLLTRLNLDGFQVAPESVFNGIAENMRLVQGS